MCDYEIMKKVILMTTAFFLTISSVTACGPTATKWSGICNAEGCAWDYAARTCISCDGSTGKSACEYSYHVGDVSLDQSCRRNS